MENHKMIVENSGLLTVAALKKLKAENKRVVSILSGGNMDVITMSSVVQQGLIFRDRIFTVSVLLPDKPGELCKVSGLIADVQGNVTGGGGDSGRGNPRHQPHERLCGLGRKLPPGPLCGLCLCTGLLGRTGT